MMFSVKSWSPAVMNILFPLIRYLPSSPGSALVRTRPRSVPLSDSVRHMVPAQVPSTNRGKNLSLSSSEPCRRMALYAPVVNRGEVLKERLLDDSISSSTRFSSLGRPIPPYSGSQESAVQPVSYTHLRAHETDSYLVCRLL